jgi:hypothetical protein
MPRVSGDAQIWRGRFHIGDTLKDDPASFGFNGQRYEPNNFAQEYYVEVTLNGACPVDKCGDRPSRAARWLFSSGATCKGSQTQRPNRLRPSRSEPMRRRRWKWPVYTRCLQMLTFVEPHFISTSQDQAGSTIYRAHRNEYPRSTRVSRIYWSICSRRSFAAERAPRFAPGICCPTRWQNWNLTPRMVRFYF